MVTEKIKAPRNASDEGLVGCLRQLQFVKGLVQRAYRAAQLPVAACQHQDVVHVSYVEQAPCGEPVVERLQVQRAEQWTQGAPP